MKRIIRVLLASIALVGTLGLTAPATAAPKLPPCLGPTSCTLPLP